ncbi:MAG: GntR family transcriptional regulator [Acidimicrobiia bacterium]|nr:GntR family transcriptional regulator [Acidimicrobiia bacterium]
MTTQSSANPSPHVSARANGTKLAAAVADRIVRDISGLGWPVGEVLGSESELLERYGVSRAVFREAVRLVEHGQVARMRPGRGGGLIITAPSLESVIDAVAVYLFFERARVDHVAAARMALEETVVELASIRLAEPDIVELRAMAAREGAGTVINHRELHSMLARLTKNPALAMFVELLSRLSHMYYPDSTRVQRKVLAESAVAHVALIDAVVAGDIGLARHRMRSHLEAEAVFVRHRLHAKQGLDANLLRSLEGSDKRGERLTRTIFLEITAGGWEVGKCLGSEQELMERYDVSRAVLREAIRLLEHLQICAMRRGPGGGLFVVQPGVESATAAMATLLEHRGIKPAHLFEVRMAVELTILDLALKRLDEPAAIRLQEALEAERKASLLEFSRVGHDLHGVLASIVDNPVLELLSLALIHLTRLHQQQRPEYPSLPSAEVTAIHSAIVEAVLARDIGLARHRLRRHLEALQLWVV